MRSSISSPFESRHARALAAVLRSSRQFVQSSCPCSSISTRKRQKSSSHAASLTQNFSKDAIRSGCDSIWLKARRSSVFFTRLTFTYFTEPWPSRSTRRMPVMVRKNFSSSSGTTAGVSSSVR